VYWSIVARRLRGRTVPLLLAAVLLAVGCTPAPKPVAPSTQPAPDLSQLWSEPADPSSLDLVHGPGGPDLDPAPGTTFTFVAKDTKGFSPGYDVRDIPGMKWSVKYGPEAQSEIVASRITWAMGYHQPPMYYVERWRLVGGDIAPDAAPPARFRPELPGWKRKGEWSWARNPFVGTQPYRGLIVLMHVLNNWDLLDQNTAIFEVRAPSGGIRHLYTVIDLGAALGRTHVHGSTRNDIDEFERQGFIKGVDKDGFVRFDDTRWRHENLYEDITPADVRWTCDRLRRLSGRQWSDAFAAARYEPQLADRFIRRLQDKIRMGVSLGDGPALARSARANRP
jgi:hypothetical protein